MDVPGLAKIRDDLLAFVEGQSKDHLLFYLASDTGLQSDVLASFFGGDRATSLKPILGEESNWFCSEKRKAEVVQLLEKLAAAPDNVEFWFALHLSLLNATIYPELKPQCGAIAESVELSQLYDDSPNAALVAARMIFSWRKNRDTAEKVLQRLVLEYFQVHADRGIEDARQYASWITECAYWLCRQEQCREDFDKRFTGLLERLLYASNDFRIALTPVIQTFSQQFSPVDYPGLQRLLLVVRTGESPRLYSTLSSRLKYCFSNSTGEIPSV